MIILMVDSLEEAIKIVVIIDSNPTRLKFLTYTMTFGEMDDSLICQILLLDGSNFEHNFELYSFEVLRSEWLLFLFLLRQEYSVLQLQEAMLQ